MSDPKRANLITVGAPKSAKNNVTKTVRLSINLDESNESKYPELNYKELVIVEEGKKKVENGKTPGLDPFSDGDDDVERVARKFEQKYGGKSTYGRRRKTKRDEFADIGAGYDENDSFIDNTDGYDEMIPPECDTFYGGFYINSGSLEFKTVPEDQLSMSEVEGTRRNKRGRISSSSSSAESSESSSESSVDEKDTKEVHNGAMHSSHDTQHRKKKNKKIEKKKAKRIRRTDSSAATSGKQTSDENVCGGGAEESVDSRTSHSDSLASKPPHSSENIGTSDSSRDAADTKLASSLPSPVKVMLEDMRTQVARLQLQDASGRDVDLYVEPVLVRIERSLSACEQRVQKCAWARVARTLGTTRAKLGHKVKGLVANSTATITATTAANAGVQSQPPPSGTPAPPAAPAPPAGAPPLKRKACERARGEGDDPPPSPLTTLSPHDRELKIIECLSRLQSLIEERKPGMIASYNAECERVQEERKKLQIAAGPGGVTGPTVEKRLPKRRFPWCVTSRSLLSLVSRLAGDRASAARLLSERVLPLFPKGFVRMPTLLRQADLKTGGEAKRQRVTSSSQPATLPSAVQFSEPITFPSSLTVTTTTAKTEKTDPSVNDIESKVKTNNVSASKNPVESQFGHILNSYTLNNKELSIEKDDRSKGNKTDKDKDKDKYMPNSIGSITITPVNNTHKSEKTNVIKPVSNAATHEKQKEPLIRVKTPATLIKEANEIATKEKDRHKSKQAEKNHAYSKEKRVQSPLLIETNFQPKEKANPSPNHRKDEISHKQVVETLRNEDKIPRPALIPVQHSPTFAKPDKRPPDSKKKKDIVIIADTDPLSDINNEPQVVDDSSSDVEVIEDKGTEKSDVKEQTSDANKLKSDVNKHKSDTVPSKDKSVIQVNHKREDKQVKQVKERDKHSEKASEKKGERMDTDDTEADIDTVMKNLRDLQDSQEPNNFSSNSFGGVITSAKHVRSGNVAGVARSQKDKLAEPTSLSKMDGCSSSEVDVA